MVAWRLWVGAGGALPGCPLRAVTGLECPGCGAARCVTALWEGDLRTALDHNLLVPVALAVLGVQWAAVMVGRAGPLDLRGAPTVTAIVLLGFWVLRLLPVPYVGSGIG